MNPLKFAAATCVLIASFITLVSSKRVPNADTPLFYLVSSTPTNPGANLLPLRVGASGGLSTLSNSAPIGQFYFFQGKFVLLDSTQSSTLQGFVNSVQTSSGCSTYGQLGFASSSSNKCAKFGGLQIQSNSEDSQLGAFLVVNFVGGFFACGSSNLVYYQANPTSGPPGLSCSPINLYTVPV